MNIFVRTGIHVINNTAQVGRLFIMLFETLRFCVSSLPNRIQLGKQLYQVGVKSLPVILLTGAFTGMVLAVQSYYQFHKITMETAIGILVGLSMTNELGPVLTALMISGRVGASMAAELGTMRVTEQVDALKTMAISPIKYLVVPRFMACIIMVPILTTFSVFIGILGGCVVGIKLLHINQTFFIQNMLEFTTAEDLNIGLIKAFVFGIIIAIVSCFKGFYAEGGAEGVGKATTQAVVLSCISILISDFFLSILLY